MSTNTQAAWAATGGQRSIRGVSSSSSGLRGDAVMRKEHQARRETRVVIVVDMQNDFGSKRGMFERAGIDISGIQKAVTPTARVLAAARQAGIRGLNAIEMPAEGLCC